MYTFCNASYLIQLTICLLIAYICQALIICIMILPWLACSFGSVKLSKHLYMLYIHVTAYFNLNLLKLQNKQYKYLLHLKASRTED